MCCQLKSENGKISTVPETSSDGNLMVADRSEALVTSFVFIVHVK